MTLFYAENVKHYMLEAVIIIILLCGLLLILWWFKHISYNYRDAVNRRNAEITEKSLEEYKSDAAENELQLTVYAKHMHFLNKALPACSALAERAAAQTKNADAIAVSDLLRGILHELNISDVKCSLQNIPQTGVRIIDAPIILMYNAAECKNVKVSADICADVEGWFTDGTLKPIDLHTVLNYLCDNAVIAASGSASPKVRAELRETEKAEPVIRIYDSGAQFDDNVLAKLGTEQVTTRPDAGGSGIGLFTVFRIMEKYGASFTLDEAPPAFGFTKLIEIAFDGRQSVKIRTCRESVVDACSARRDITVELIDNDMEELRDGTCG